MECAKGGFAIAGTISGPFLPRGRDAALDMMWPFVGAWGSATEVVFPDCGLECELDSGWPCCSVLTTAFTISFWISASSLT
eukprot:523533-Amorphochlora_amoeboformis.AAC.1